MDYYDLVSETCEFDDSLRERLGFRKIGILGMDIMPAGANKSNLSDFSNDLAFGKEKGLLISLVQKGVKGVAITDSYIDKKLLEVIADAGCILVLPMGIITASYGIERTRNIYRMSRLFEHARKMKIPVSFVSMAKTPQHMNSYMQLLELAKLLGADDKYARESMTKTNKRLVTR